MMGNLTRDPEFKQLPSGQGVCRLGLAANRQFRPKNATEVVQEVCFVDVDVWGAQAENCQKFLFKGSSVLIEGRLKFDSWQDGDGQKRSRHSIIADRVTFIKSGASEEASEDNENEVAASPKSSASHARGASSAQQGAVAPKRAARSAPKAKNEDFEDELPF
jgi:single-strand DNA-binding protein